MLYEDQSGDILMALAGDSFINRRLSVFREERFLAMAELIREADVSVTNAEVMFHRYEGSAVWDAGVYGTYVASEPELIDELKWLGIKMVACANNHAGDYGEVGVLKNLENLEAHAMPHAGTGRTLSEAVAPAYLDTPKGRVALISVTCTIPAGGQRAGDPLGVTRGRPGANVLRHEATNTLPPDEFDSLQRIAGGLGLPARPGAAGELNFLGQKFVRGEAFSRQTSPNQHDLDLNLRWIRDARRMADWVIVSVHCHERGASADEMADFAQTFARAAVDAGADVVHGHGPHQDRGIELYRGKPIFHSLGNFIMQNDLVKWEPRDAYLRLGLSPESTPAEMYDHRTGNDTRGAVTQPIQWQSAVAQVRFEEQELREIRLFPVDLGLSSGKRTMRGRPVLASGAVATEVLERFRRLSEPFGTRIEVEDGVGVIRCC